MNLTQRIEREIAAIKRDREQKKPSYTLEEVMEHMKQYPSLLTRASRFQAKIERGIDNVRSLPYDIRCFVHRGRYGWCNKDTWSMDNALARQLDAQFEKFITYHDPESDDCFCGAPMSFADMDQSEEWKEEHNRQYVADLKTIQQGFRNYWMNNENSWKIDDINERMAADKAASDGVRESLRLMGEHWEGLWW